MKLSRLCAAAALAVAASGSMAADLGTINLGSGSAIFGNTPIVGGFIDSLMFTLSLPSTFNGSVTSVVNGNQDVDFTAIVLTGPAGSFAFNQLLSDPVEVFATPAAGFFLTPGTYTLTLLGNNSAGAASYGGNLAVTPIPEPQTLALMLAGVAALGFMGKRRLS